MNKKLKCILAAVLAAVIAMSMILVMPATAAEKGKSPAAEAAESSSQADENVANEFREAMDLVPLGGEEDEPTQEPMPADSEDEPEAKADLAVTGSAEADEDPSSVGDVTDVTRTSEETDLITISWNAADNAQGYHVYWRNGDDSSAKFKLLTTVKDTALTVRKLKVGALYEFKVAAYKAYEGKLYEGKSTTVRCATAPSAVKSFRLTSGAQKGTVLKWTKNEMCDGYIMYRQYDSVWSKVKEIPADTTEFTDTDVIPGKAYYYRLFAYRRDVGGTLKSAYSEVKTVCGLCAPKDNGTFSILRRMNFRWKKNSFATGYEIRYSADNKNFTLLVDTKNTYYNSNRFKNGKLYYFRIYPYRLVGKNKTRVYGTYLAKSLTITNSAYGQSVPTTYIEVSRDQQHMWFYINDEIYVSTDVVTGNYNSMDTPAGYWSVNNKAAPATLVGADYVTQVDYWIAFIGSGYGIHDASWRSSFGGTIYKGNGSHGCINTPYNNVKKIYGKVKIGTPVIVY